MLAINNPLSYKEFLPISRLQNKQKRVLIVSRLWNYKRIDMSLEIWKLIEEQVGDWELRIIGDGPEEEYLRRLVCRYNLKRVVFIPYLSVLRYDMCWTVFASISNRKFSVVICMN